ncbi:MAG: hypothetical protein COS47_01140 [Candidatus Nealsonbacteria bacterium CG03_land_8_20_14_0_80_36_12]|uniref:Serine aminopeptidase S33 domain-containing protein n=1 Tax=Candidatus Nealsonbacteria bacterium CG03_land_8_20_14_0_80_36_12 TaxID=1974701 RepID=A0A2M7BYE3_9BACT|nr:MAG: hypothetical protein COS47_01140 [Candidatus Nealsonbacteria bacterium CG03_land_8_20_14_0_80_36_12]
MDIYFKKGKIGILLIHGLNKSPEELRQLALRLAAENFTVFCPTLPGHGSCPKDYGPHPTINDSCPFQVMNSTLKEWNQKVEESFNFLNKKVDKIYLAGVSLGGNLAFHLAGSKKINGLISLGAPIFLSKGLDYGLKLASGGLRFFNTVKGKEKIMFHNVQLSYVEELIGVLEQTKKDLPKVKCPVLIFHSLLDDISHPKSAKYVFRKIRSNNKKLVWLKNSVHGITFEKDQLEKIFQETVDFFSEIEKLNTY